MEVILCYLKKLKKINIFRSGSSYICWNDNIRFEAAIKAVNIPSNSAFKHTAIIGNNRADTSNIIISKFKTNNFILINQYSGLSYALMNSANAAKTGSYILPVNDGSIQKNINISLHQMNLL